MEADLLFNNPDSNTDAHFNELLESLPCAIYGCDADGYVNFFNQAAVELWGRSPEIGKDLWCGSWKIFKTDGSPLPPSEYPIAITLKEGRPVYGQEIIVERPDGVRLNIIPHPKPLFNSLGKIYGAINTLVDITSTRKAEEKTAQVLRKSESNLRAIFNNSKDGYVLVGNDLNILAFNHVADGIYKNVMGKTLAEGNSVLDTAPQTHREYMKEALQKVLQGHSFERESKYVGVDSKEYWVRGYYNPVKNETGEIIGICIGASDITEQKLKDEALRESEERFRMVADTAPVMIWMTNASRECIFVNKGWCEFSGVSYENGLKEGWKDIVHTEDLSHTSQAFIKAHENYSEYSHELRLKRKDGEYRWIKDYAVPRFHNNVFLGYIGSCIDITDSKTAREKLQNEVEKRTAELQKTNYQLEQFAYIASHDLQEPLRKIRVFSELLGNNLGNVELSKTYFSKIQSSAQRMSVLIKDVLDYSRLSQTQDHYTEVNLDHVLDNVLSDFELTILQKKARFTRSKLPIIVAVPMQMNQLFSNLISNALKFCTTEPHIEISSEFLKENEYSKYEGLNNNQKYIVLVFKDNGIGFEQKYADQIFTIFHRLNSKSEFSGTGIGLALCKKIVENHNGLISASGEINKGATFNIILPVYS